MIQNFEREPNRDQPLGHRVEARAIEFFEDSFDEADEVWQTEKSEKGDDKKGIDAGIKYAGCLLAPDFTTGDERTVLGKVKSMERNPFTYIKIPGAEEDVEALRFVIRLHPDDWKDYCDGADANGQRVAERLPHNLLVREKKKIIDQMLGQISAFEPYCKTNPRRKKILDSVKKALEEEWK